MLSSISHRNTSRIGSSRTCTHRWEGARAHRFAERTPQCESHQLSGFAPIEFSACKQLFKYLRDETRRTDAHANPCCQLKGMWLHLLRRACFCSWQLWCNNPYQSLPFLWVRPRFRNQKREDVPVAEHGWWGYGHLDIENAGVQLPLHVGLGKASNTLHKLWRHAKRPVAGEARHRIMMHCTLLYLLSYADVAQSVAVIAS